MFQTVCQMTGVKKEAEGVVVIEDIQENSWRCKNYATH